MLILAALVGVGLVLHWLRGAFAKTVNRNVVLRGQHRRGQQLVSAPITVASEHELSALSARVLGHVDVPAKPRNAVYPTIYLAEQTPQTLTFICGTRLQTLFTARVDIQEDGEGSLLHFSVPSWTEADGIVAQLSQLEELKEKVVSAAA